MSAHFITITITTESLAEGELATSCTVQGPIAEGRTLAETIELAQDAARHPIESCIEHGDPLTPAPGPSSAGTGVRRAGRDCRRTDRKVKDVLYSMDGREPSEGALSLGSGSGSERILGPISELRRSTGRAAVEAKAARFPLRHGGWRRLLPARAHSSSRIILSGLNEIGVRSRGNEWRFRPFWTLKEQRRPYRPLIWPFRLLLPFSFLK